MSISTLVFGVVLPLMVCIDWSKLLLLIVGVRSGVVGVAAGTFTSMLKKALLFCNGGVAQFHALTLRFLRFKIC